ncbi:MAG: hypothetical protein QM286_00685 [Acidobacteriota bacterium]|jgi:hypothetical protein|nr:hypothetical protein [Acidobacteriota bacterium]
MSYRVVAALTMVQSVGGGWDYFEKGAAIPDDAAESSVRHLLEIGHIVADKTLEASKPKRAAKK